MTHALPAVLAAQRLAGAALRVIATRPGALLRTETRRTIWGLALIWRPDKKFGSVALSPLGLAHLVGRQSPWDYPTPPDMPTLTGMLATEIKHAFRNNNPADNLFAMPPSYGACGRHVLYCRMDQPLFSSWMLDEPFAGQADALPVIPGAEWTDSLATGAQSEEDAVFAPPPVDPEAWLSSLVFPLIHEGLPMPEQRARAAAILRHAITEAHSRATHLERYHPTMGVAPYPWMLSAEETVTRILDAVMPATPSVAGSGTPPPSGASRSGTRVATATIAGVPVLSGPARRGGVPQPPPTDPYTQGYQAPGTTGDGMF